MLDKPFEKAHSPPRQLPVQLSLSGLAWANPANRWRAISSFANPLELVDQWLPGADRPLLKAVARRAVWLSEPRRQILARFLAFTASGSDHRIKDAVELLRLVETFQPADLRELLAQIPHWQQVIRQQINAGANPKPFFNERAQELHGGGRDQRRQDLSRLANRETELDVL